MLISFFLLGQKLSDLSDFAPFLDIGYLFSEKVAESQI